MTPIKNIKKIHYYTFCNLECPHLYFLSVMSPFFLFKTMAFNCSGWCPPALRACWSCWGRFYDRRACRSHNEIVEGCWRASLFQQITRVPAEWFCSLVSPHNLRTNPSWMITCKSDIRPSQVYCRTGWYVLVQLGIFRGQYLKMFPAICVFVDSSALLSFGFKSISDVHLCDSNWNMI